MSRSLIILALFFTLSNVNAQFSMGLMGGVANYQGDLAKDITTLEETHAMFGGSVGYRVNANIDVKLQLLATRISGDDANYPDDPGRLSRALKFETNILEFAVIGEYFLRGSAERSGTGVFTPRFSPLAYFGAGITKLGNKVECLSEDCKNGVVTDLFPEPGYKSTLVSLPVGLGFKYDTSPVLSFGMRAGYRYTLSDYLDGVSIYANPSKDDWYFIIGANVVFYFVPRDSGF